MNYLLIVDSVLSKKTERYWTANRDYILDFIKPEDIYYPETRPCRVPSEFEKYDVYVLVGDDRFFSCFINSAFYRLSDEGKEKTIAFIPDSRNSALVEGLGFPNGLHERLELIKANQTIYLDVVRCHCVDQRGLPKNFFMLNDVLIGISSIKLPFFIKTLAGIARCVSIPPLKKGNREISLINNGNEIYRGSYVFSAVLLGNRITDGPRLKPKERVRCGQIKFDYLQINTEDIRQLKVPLVSFFPLQDSSGVTPVFSGKYSEIDIRGNGQDNPVIGDGVHLGYLPATFTFLPRAVKIISPLLTVRVTQPWSAKLSHAGLPKPISRDGICKNKYDE